MIYVKFLHQEKALAKIHPFYRQIAVGMAILWSSVFNLQD
jgi:hypothetical protein